MAVIRRGRENGYWQAIVRRKGHPPQRKVFRSQQDAKRRATQFENEIDRGVFVDRRPTFGAYSLAALQPRHIAAYREERLASGKPGATVAKEMKCLSLVIDAAVKDWGFRSRTTPCAASGCPQPRPEGIGGSRVHEEQAVLSACAKSRTPMLVAVVLAIETGMRLGELVARDWRDIDTMKRTATLRETKNGESRVVPLSSAALRVLSELPRHISNGRVFWVWSRRDSFENAWRRAVARACIPDLRFHDLRHEAVSRFFERGLNVMEAAAISGHKTLQMLKRYTHLKAETLARRLA